MKPEILVLIPTSGFVMKGYPNPNGLARMAKCAAILDEKPEAKAMFIGQGATEYDEFFKRAYYRHDKRVAFICESETSIKNSVHLNQESITGFFAINGYCDKKSIRENAQIIIVSNEKECKKIANALSKIGFHKRNLCIEKSGEKPYRPFVS